MTRTVTPIRRVLVANRGEIACRIMRTLHETGRTAIAVHSSVDARAPHVALADVALPIGGASVAESYLSIERIVEAAHEAGADAVHPGYGLLSENAAFASACEAAGLNFIGPASESIRLMANKSAARRRMQAVGVDCVPGYDGEDQSDDALAEAASAIGYPIMVKAADGGGGRGMRLVDDAGELRDALRAARAEARSAFGSDALILERALRAPRHVEVQVLGDEHGTIVHLGERDCSVQRRHQKVIEEAPAPAVDEALRAELGAAAVRAAQAIDYVGAGTVEFLLDADGAFYFLEMNTRLQVEHPVTELVTGHDLVALQLHVAEGRLLPFQQADVRLDGHAIEVRLYAEDPAQDFLPQTGRVLHWQGPGEARTDAGIATGDLVTPHYDPLLAKIAAHGRDRESARRRLVRALHQTELLGVRHNRDFLIAALDDERFVAGEATTHFIGERRPAGRAHDDALVAAVAAVAWYRSGGDPRPVIPAELRDWCSAGRLTVRCPFAWAEPPSILALGDDRYRIRHGEQDTELIVVEQQGAALVLRLNGERHSVTTIRDGRRLWLASPFFSGPIELQGGREADRQADDAQVLAPMHGRVVELRVAAGDEVSRGQTVAVIEAMKMQHAVAAARDGQVSAVHCAEGVQVAADALIIELATEA